MNDGTTLGYSVNDLGVGLSTDRLWINELSEVLCCFQGNNLKKRNVLFIKATFGLSINN